MMFVLVLFLPAYLQGVMLICQFLSKDKRVNQMQIKATVYGRIKIILEWVCIDKTTDEGTYLNV